MKRCSLREAGGLHFGGLLVGAAALLFGATTALTACDDEPPPPPAGAPPPGAKAPPPPGAPPPPPPPPVTKAPVVANVIEEKTLGDEDFVESLEDNRDPFRSYLGAFAAPAKRTVKVQRKVLMGRYGLDELRLAAVITGPVRARAMFIDPKGLGVSVKRGDYISKNYGRIKQILPNKVVVQLEERTEDMRKMADRVIELHPRSERERLLRLD